MKKGSGSVVKRKGKFHARWRIQGEESYGQARDTWEEADYDRVNNRPGVKKAPAGHHPSLQEFAYWCMDTTNERYGGYGRGISKGEGGGGKGTYGTNESIRVNQLEGSKLGKMKIRSIDRFDLINFAMALTKLEPYKENGITKYRPGTELVSDAWRLRVMAFVSKMFTLAVQHGFIKHNPCKDLGLPQPSERINTILSQEEMTDCFEVNDRTDEIILFLSLTGLRKSELIRVLWTDLKGDTIWVRSAPNKGGTQPVILCDDALAILQNQPKRGIHIFTTASGKPLGSRNLTRDVKNRLEKRGIDPEVRLHDLRGTFGNMLVDVANADIKTVQVKLRHKSVKTTIKSYLRSQQSTQKVVVETLASKLKPKAAEKMGAVDRGRSA